MPLIGQLPCDRACRNFTFYRFFFFFLLFLFSIIRFFPSILRKERAPKAASSRVISCQLFPFHRSPRPILYVYIDRSGRRGPDVWIVKTLAA